MGAVACGQGANAPFPIPAHRTGRADRGAVRRPNPAHVISYSSTKLAAANKAAFTKAMKATVR
jgi:hypothetical protein